MLQGAILAGFSILLLLLGAIFAILPLGAGVAVIAVGYYLDNLYPLAWWVVIIINFLTLAGILIGTFYSTIVDQIPLTSTDIITFTINGILSTFVLGYLLKRDVRTLFFEVSPSPEL